MCEWTMTVAKGEKEWRKEGEKDVGSAEKVLEWTTTKTIFAKDDETKVN